MIPTSRLILSDFFKEQVKADRVKIFDVGARQELFSPYNELPAELFKIYGFEPDAEEALRLSRAYDPKDREYFPYGLWKESTKINLSYAELPGNSSIHPPNMSELKKLFPKKHWETRNMKQELELEVKSIDDLTLSGEYDCDLLKVDTQGSELEIIQGAKKLLQSSVSFVLLESWTYEVHKGQALSGQIMEWMNSIGFTLIRVHEGAKWHRTPIKEIEERGLKTLVGLDLLFVRNNFDFGDHAMSTNKTLKAAALAELYGFPDLAIQILDSINTSEGQSNLSKSRQIIIQNWKKKSENIIFRIVRKILYTFGFHIEKIAPSPYAPLH